MMTYMMKGKKLGESTVRQWMNEIECGQNATTEGVRKFDDMGGMITNYTGVLSEKVGIAAHTIYNEAPVRRWVSTATPKKPLLAHVFWAGGGGHTVLVVSHHSTNTIFLDPGLGVVEIPDASLLSYTVDYGGGNISGTILALAQP